MQKGYPPQSAKTESSYPGTNGERYVTGVIYDKKVPVKLKDKIRKTVIRSTMTYGAGCWTMKKKDEMLMNNTELILLRRTQCVSFIDDIRNEEIRKVATVQPITSHLMQKRLRWYGHVTCKRCVGIRTKPL